MATYREILEAGSRTEKIRALEDLSDTTDPEMIRLITDRLSDQSIEVRGEAFAALVSNSNDIAGHLTGRLDSPDANIRAFCTLVLANRRDNIAAGRIFELTDDPDRNVRQCAMGALGFLRSDLAGRAIHARISDESIEVRKSAVQAAIDTGERLTPEEIAKASKGADAELTLLISVLGGPGGI